jgi:hypothetical protein
VYFCCCIQLTIPTNICLASFQISIKNVVKNSD